MPVEGWRFSSRHVDIGLGLLLAATSFAPWWRRESDGSTSSAWTGPHFSWLPVILCLGIVAARSLPQPGLGNRWAAIGAALAWAIAAGGWLTEVVQRGAAPIDGSHQLAWELQKQGPGTGSIDGPFDTAWGYPTGLLLIGLLLATFAASAVANRTR